MRDKRILITGAAGSIGSELVRQLCVENYVYGLDINESGLFDLYQEGKLIDRHFKTRVGDIRDRYTVEEVFDGNEFDIVFHAAAYKHVTPMEHVPLEAVNTNIIGLANVLYSSKRHKVEKLIFISSDKAVLADGVMGCTKRLGEMITRNAGYVNVRFGNVQGSRGSLFTIWDRQIKSGYELTVTDPRMERYMMSIEDACSLSTQAAERGNPGETIILDMGEKVNIYELAKQKNIEAGRNPNMIRFIGRRSGEHLTEELMSEQEKLRARKDGRFYVINARNYSEDISIAKVMQ